MARRFAAPWLAQGQFHPAGPIRELRERTRYRKTLVQERAQEANRLHKVLESANIKLGAVASDVLGTSGRAMLAALLAGEQDAVAMAELARGRLRAKLPALRQALEGRVTAQHRVLLRHILTHLDFLDGQLEQLTGEIERPRPLSPTPSPCADASRRGGDRGQRHRRGDRDGHESLPLGGSPRLLGRNLSRAISRAAASALAGTSRQATAGCGRCWVKSPGLPFHTHDTYPAALYHRLARRRGKQRAIVAVAHSLWSASITCSAPTSPTMTWDPTTSISSTTHASNANMSAA